MNASPPTGRWRSLLIAIATIASFTLAEETENLIHQQQPNQQKGQKNAAADVKEENEHTAKIIISPSLVGDSNNQPYPKRPSSIIQIDLDDFLSIIDMDNATSLSEDTDQDKWQDESIRIQKNEVSSPLGIPQKRFTLWSELTKKEQSAMEKLQYDEITWDNPMTNPIEMLSFKKLTTEMKLALNVLSIAPPQWDCHVNHYYGHTWDQLSKARVQFYFVILGWTRESWDYGNATKPDVEGMTWDELSHRQKVIASEICYFNRETWDELPLSTWVVEWRKLDERQKFPVSSSSSLKAVQ